MKQGTTELIKFRKLMRRLKESQRGVVGLLELLWYSAAKQCPQGDIGRFSNEDIAELLDWDGPADELIDALVSCDWLEKSAEYRLIVHDWHDHAPGFIHAALGRKGLDFVTRVAKEPPSAEPSGDQSPEPSPERSGESSAEHSPCARPFSSLVNSCPVNESNKPPYPPSPDGKGEDGVSASASPSKTKTQSSPKAERPKREPPFDPVQATAGEPWGDGLRRAWADWVSHQRERRSPLTPTTTRVLVERLRDWGEARAVAAIKHSIANGWQGLIEPEDARAGPTGMSLQDEVSAKIEAARQRLVERSKEAINAR